MRPDPGANRPVRNDSIVSNPFRVMRRGDSMSDGDVTLLRLAGPAVHEASLSNSCSTKTTLSLADSNRRMKRSLSGPSSR